MSTTHVCRNCQNHFSGKFCNACGEKVFSPSDKSLKHFLHEFAHFLFHLDGSISLTIKTFFKKPGKVSLDYCDGIRKPYFKPLSLFLLLVVIYLIFPYFQGLNQNLYYYTQHAAYGKFARDKIITMMAHTGMDFNELSKIFHERAAKVSKFLLILLIPLSALLLRLMAYKRKKYFFDHVIFAAELNSMYILITFLLLPLVIAVFQWVYHRLTNGYVPFDDNLLTFIILPILLTYIAIAARRFYGYSIWRTIVFSFVFLGLHNYLIIMIYKFILFTTVINTFR